MKRRAFLQQTVAAPAYAGLAAYALDKEAIAASSLPAGRYTPGRIVNEYNLLLPGEAEELKNSPRVVSFAGGKVEVSWGNENKSLAPGEVIGGWQLVAILPWMNGTPTAVFEKNVTHQGDILYVTAMGEIARIPKRLGKAEQVRPRPTSTPHDVKLERPISMFRSRRLRRLHPELWRRPVLRKCRGTWGGVYRLDIGGE